MNMWIETIGKLFFLTVIVMAAFSDRRTRRIPNALTFSGAAVAFVMHASLAGWSGAWMSITGAAAGIGLLSLPFLMGGMGAGDVKLLGCAGAMLGAWQVFCAFLAASMLGVLLAVAALAARAETDDQANAPEEPDGRRAHIRIPYGLPLAAGVLLSAVGAWML